MTKDVCLIMGKIGIITLYKGNYGSALQCYSTKYYLFKMGYDSEIIFKERHLVEKGFLKIGSYIKNLIDPQKRNIKYYITEESRLAINNFVERLLSPKGYYKKELKKLGNSKIFDGFIAGSDQIWNLRNCMDNYYFLNFAESNKKIAFAVSLGADSFSAYNIHKLKTRICDIRFISTREEAGKKILQNIYHGNLSVVADPTILLLPEQWREFSQTGIRLSYKYILVHFIDEPSLSAFRCIEAMRQILKCKVVSVGYRHHKIVELNESVFMDGNPIDYVSMIANAAFVITDSYHTTLFSIYLEKPFRVFERQYQTRYSQNSRIKHILQMYGMEECFNNSSFNVSFDRGYVTNVLSHERTKTEQFLKSALQSICPKK